MPNAHSTPPESVPAQAPSNALHSADRGAPRQATAEEWVAGLAMLGVMVVGLWQAAQALSKPTLHDVPHGWADIRSGVSSDGFSKYLDKHLPMREDLIAWANAGRYVLTQGAGDQVRLGKDEWLFSVEELQYHPQAAANQAARLRRVGEVSVALQRKGIALLVVLVPDKARVQAPQMSHISQPHWYAQRYASLVLGLQTQGVATVDTLPAMLKLAQTTPVYYRTDTHWNQAGAQLVANLTAQRLRAGGTLTPLAPFETTQASAPTERVGDLLNMLGLAHMPNALRPNPDTERVDTTQKTSTQAASMGLLDDVSMPVVLVGTSYSLRANFHGYLQSALQAEVLNVAADGGGFVQSMVDYLKDEAFSAAPPQWVVWEIPERVFSAPLTDAEKAPLPL